LRIYQLNYPLGRRATLHFTDRYFLSIPQWQNVAILGFLMCKVREIENGRLGDEGSAGLPVIEEQRWDERIQMFLFSLFFSSFSLLVYSHFDSELKIVEGEGKAVELSQDGLLQKPRSTYSIGKA
jgi:hypothetical protein